MKDWVVSKFFGGWPATIAFVFALGMFIASPFIENSNKAIILVWPLVGFVLLSVLAKKSSLICLSLSLILGFVFMLSTGLFYYEQNLAAGCMQGRVSSFAKKYGNNFDFNIFLSDGKRMVARFENDNVLRLGQEISLCFGDDNIIAVSKEESLGQLARYQTLFVVKDPDVRVLKNENLFFGGVNAFLARVKSISQIVFPGDKGVLARGLVFGGSQDFSNEFKQMVKKSGVSHLTAVSGYNVSLIIILLFSLIRVKMSRRSAFASTIVVLIAFWIITGGSASVTRAGIMGLIVLIGRLVGRPNSAINSLFVASLIMVVINPFVLWDIGFRLSFFATLGLVSLGDTWVIVFEKIKINGIAKSLLQILAETTSAQIFTLPILLYHFGQVSIIGIITNLLILPFVPIVMLLVGITIAFGFLSIRIALIVGLIGDIFLSYFMVIIKFFGNLSFAQLLFDEGNTYLCVGLLLIILICSNLVKYMIKTKYEGKNIA